MVIMSVVSVPLKPELWQIDRLNKIFECHRQVYNASLSVCMKNYKKMLRDAEYIETKGIITETYKIQDEKEKKKAKSADLYKNAVKRNNEILKEYGLTEFGICKIVLADPQKHFKENVSTHMATYGVAKPLWAAFEKLLFGNGETIHYKKAADQKSIASDGKSGIRILNAEGDTVHTRVGKEPLYVSVGNGKNHSIIIPIMIDDEDPFRIEMLQRKYRHLKIVRKYVKGKARFTLQIVVEGPPAEKIDKETGEIKHPLGEGHCGIYIDTQDVVVAHKEGITRFDLSQGITNNEDRKAELQRFLDTSRRISNPDNYNEDGTIKKGIIGEDGKRHKLRWVYSQNYKDAKAELADIFRIEAENRTIQRHIICNNILALGDSFSINDYPFQAAAMRKKETEYTESGRPKSKAKAGKAIGENAPATLVTMLQNAVAAKGLPPVIKVQIRDIDRSIPDYKAEYAVLLRDGKI